MQLFSRTITLYQQDLELIQQLYVNIYTEVLFPYSSLKMQTAEMLAYTEAGLEGIKEGPFF